MRWYRRGHVDQEQTRELRMLGIVRAIEVSTHLPSWTGAASRHVSAWTGLVIKIQVYHSMRGPSRDVGVLWMRECTGAGITAMR